MTKKEIKTIGIGIIIALTAISIVFWWREIGETILFAFAVILIKLGIYNPPGL